jgi:ureidoglycolate hydrolase
MSQHKSVCHHNLMNMDEPGDYPVIDHMGPRDNYAEQRLARALAIEKL